MFGLPEITLDQIKTWLVYDPENPLLFGSGLFLIIFLIFYLVYILTRKHIWFRSVYVILFSLFFYYKAGGMFWFLLLIVSITDYHIAKMLHRSKKDSIRKLWLFTSVLINLGLLAHFKYTNFLFDSLNDLFSSNFAIQDIILPIGISFFVFETMSYTIDIYRREIEPAKNFLDFAFFVCFFPKFVAGPIVRAKDFLPQINQKLTLTKIQASSALFLIIGGLIKKSVISDYISINFVDRVFDAPNSYTSIENLLAVYGYSLQIYCDFSGYSDIAIGLALLMGFELNANFRTPYQSANITEFWHRWHISLSTWLRDYLYISIGGNRRSSFWGYLFPALFFGGLIGWSAFKFESHPLPFYLSLAGLLIFLLPILLSKNRKKASYVNFNQMTTMLLGGLWHGASFRFVIWGALHGLALGVHKTFKEYISKKANGKRTVSGFLSRLAGVFITFQFVSFCWIFFRSKDFDTSIQMVQNIAGLDFNFDNWLTVILSYRHVFLIFLIGYIWHFIPENLLLKVKLIFNSSPIAVKSILVAAVFWLIYATASSEVQPFIYFQF